MADLKTNLIALKNNPKALIAIAAVLFFLDAAVVLKAQVVFLGRTMAEARKLQANIRTARDDARFFSKNKDRLGDLQSELTDLSKMTITEEGLAGVIESISKFADVSSVRILKIKPAEIRPASKEAAKGPPKTEEGYIKEKITIMAKCGFHQLGRFIALVENSPVFLDVKTLEIQTDAQEFSKQAVTIVLEVLIRKA